MGRMIGIDLGTTNSLAAVWKDRKCTLIPNAFGEYLTPSVVSIGEDGAIYVGKTAKERLLSHPQQSAGFFKRFMGTPRKYKLGDRTYLPEELSSFVLRKLKEDAENYLGEPVSEAVVSVPAYFNDMARNATKRAGALAGFKVERIINEPSAAALACQNRNQEEDATMLVFDFGGGTLDVSLVECFDNVIEILAVSGDNQLGGQDFDGELADYFIRSAGIDDASLTPETREVIRGSAEACKRALTEEKTAEMIVNCPQLRKKMEISRKDLIKICALLFERMVKPVRQVLTDARMPAGQISHVILVGGSCKMPVVQQYIRHILGRADVEAREPDHMIALGCGVCAGIMERDQEVKDMLLTDICPFSLGVDVMNYQERDKPLMSFIITRNSPLPISREQTYVTAHDYQTSMCFKIYQGEEMYAENNIYLGEISFDIPMAKKGEVACNVRFTYDINGVLEIQVGIPCMDEVKKLVIVNEGLGMTEEEIAAKLEELEKVKVNPAQEEENLFVLEWGQRLFAQCIQEEIRNDIIKRLQYFRHVMTHDAYHLPRVRKYTTVFFAYVEGILNSSIAFPAGVSGDGGWYEEMDDEEKEIDSLFNEWDEDKEG